MMSRANFLRGSAAALGTAAGAAGCANDAGTPAPPDPDSPAGADDSGLPAFTEDGCEHVTRMAPVTGPGVTTRFRMEATDLGAPATTPDGRTLFIFGDTFEEAVVGGGFWRSPVGLFADPDVPLDEGIRWTSAVGGETAEQLVPYEHDEDPVSTILPGDVLTIGDTMYLWVMVNHGFGTVASTEIWTSADSGETWDRTAEMFPGDHLDGFSQQCTWALHPTDGHVYLLTTGFQRDKEAILQRVAADSILDPGAYETWGAADGDSDADESAGQVESAGNGQGHGAKEQWAWGNTPTPVLAGQVGEMCLRIVDDKWLLTWFNAGEYRVGIRAADSPTALADAEPVTLLWGGEWGAERNDSVAQLYGPYIVPGSTLEVLHLVCSQCHTGPDWPYHVEQFRFTRPLEDICGT